MRLSAMRVNDGGWEQGSDASKYARQDSDDRSNGNYEATVALTPEARAAAYHVRYRVYIIEQHKAYPEADHERSWLTDKLDANAVIIIASGTEGPCGTVRANFADFKNVKETYEEQFELDRFQHVPNRAIAICSRLAVVRKYRATPVSRILFREIYRYGIGRGTRLTFQSCTPSLRPLFFRYGFREYLSPFLDPVVGPLHRMLLVLDDLLYLAKLRSPFLSIAEQLGVTSVKRPWLDEMFEAHEGRDQLA